MTSVARKKSAKMSAVALVAVVIGLMLSAVPSVSADSPLGDVLNESLPKMVKIYGAGGFQGMECYQSGSLISADGHILTVFSYVLDTDEILVTLDDGRKFSAELLGADPRLELAVLKIDGENLPHFDLTAAPELDAGSRILALSNTYGVAAGSEPVSVQHGVVAVRTTLAARRGAFSSPYKGSVYILDTTTNNQGAAGGALIRRSDGQLAAMLGKELRSESNNTWLNYAVPVAEMIDSIDAIREGRFSPSPTESESQPVRPMQLSRLGIALVPDVLPRTPPYVDQIRRGSVAAELGLRPDDLIVLIGDRLIQSCSALNEELAARELEDPIQIGFMRGDELIEMTLEYNEP